jgi:hypothetical protein
LNSFISLDLNKTFHSKPPSSYKCDWSHKYISHVVKAWVYVTHLLYFTSILTVAFNVITPLNWAIFLENGGSTSFQTVGGTHLPHYIVSQITNTLPPPKKNLYHYGNLRCQEWLHLYIFTVHTPILTDTSNTRSDMYTDRHDM